MSNNSIFHGTYKVTGCFLQSDGYWTEKNPHRGLDLVGIDSKQIFAPVAGVVGHAGDSGDGFGIYVRIDAANGRKYYLCHMASEAVKIFQKVNVGDFLGIMGSTGNVTGAHTHFEIRDAAGNIYSGADFLGIPNKQGTYESSVNYAIPAAIVHIDTLAQNSVITGDVNLIGWTIGPDGMTRADIYVNGKTYLGSTKTLSARPDVEKAYAGKGFRNAGNSGISFKVPYSKLPKGKHTLNIAGVPAVGKATWMNIAVTVK